MKLRAWISIVSMAGLVVGAGCGAHGSGGAVPGSSTGIDTGDSCDVVCGRLAGSGCTSPSATCVSTCQSQAATTPTACQGAANSLFTCARTAMVTCDSSGAPQIPSCLAQGLALSDCSRTNSPDSGARITANTLYGACTPGPCPDGTTCVQAQLSTSHGSICTSSCAAASDCFVQPGFPDTPTCVLPAGSTRGQCYYPCDTRGTCSLGTTPNTTTGTCVCVP